MRLERRSSLGLLTSRGEIEMVLCCRTLMLRKVVEREGGFSTTWARRMTLMRRRMRYDYVSSIFAHNTDLPVSNCLFKPTIIVKSWPFRCVSEEFLTRRVQVT